MIYMLSKVTINIYRYSTQVYDLVILRKILLIHSIFHSIYANDL